MSNHWFLYHTSEDPFAFPAGPGALKLRLFVPAGQHLSCTVVHSDRYDSPGSEQPQSMEKIGSAGAYEIHEAVIRTETGKCRYLFYVKILRVIIHGTENGESPKTANVPGLFNTLICMPTRLELPSWTSGAIVYQIYPSSYNRGTLQGITEKIPYLQELGVTAVYMTPIFESPSEHKYNTSDYYKIDPDFGTAEDLKELVAEAHRHGIKVLLDAVFNHSGDTFLLSEMCLNMGRIRGIRIGSLSIPIRLSSLRFQPMRPLQRPKPRCPS